MPLSEALKIVKNLQALYRYKTESINHAEALETLILYVEAQQELEKQFFEASRIVSRN